MNRSLDLSHCIFTWEHSVFLLNGLTVEWFQKLVFFCVKHLTVSDTMIFSDLGQQEVGVNPNHHVKCTKHFIQLCKIFVYSFHLYVDYWAEDCQVDFTPLHSIKEIRLFFFLIYKSQVFPRSNLPRCSCQLSLNHSLAVEKDNLHKRMIWTFLQIKLEIIECTIIEDIYNSFLIEPFFNCQNIYLQLCT